MGRRTGTDWMELSECRTMVYSEMWGYCQDSCKEGYLYKDILEYETGKRVTVDDSLRRVYVGDRRIEQYEFIHDYYFAAGDNAYDSYDSRYWGLVPEEYIVGVVDLISYSRILTVGNSDSTGCLKRYEDG